MSTHPAVAKLSATGAADAAVATFARQLERVRAGETGLLAEADLEPVDDLPDADVLPQPSAEEARDVLAQAVVLKLSGGLGTSMGLDGPKALLPVKGEMTFLDVIARQVLALRERSRSAIPLVLMHSFATRDASLAALERYPALCEQAVPLDFLQGRVPKLAVDDLKPVEWPAEPGLEWAPPGHGDVYPSLVASGMLDALLGAGRRYAFVSNADNLGATLDDRLLCWFASTGAPFAMEVADRTTADRKGGHLARLAGDGGLVLREVAQTPEDDLDAFQDTGRHRFFNTNSLWIDLQALADLLGAADGVLDLPIIVNRKTVDPRDPDSTKVLQLETAMGAAIGEMDGAVAIRVPRTRMAPVKTTGDLLAVRSDAYVLTEEQAIELDPERDGWPPIVVLDDATFKRVGDFDERFADGPPSLVACERLEVVGDVTFGAGVVVRGSVRVAADGPGRLKVPAGSVLEG